MSEYIPEDVFEDLYGELSPEEYLSYLDPENDDDVLDSINLKEEYYEEPTKRDFTFQNYLDSNPYYNITKTNLFLENNPDIFTSGLEYIDESVDILITYSWSDKKKSITSSIYEAYELYYYLKINSLPVDLGGPNIKLMFCDYLVFGSAFATKTDLGPNSNYGNEVLKAVFTKYDGNEKILKSLEGDLIFRNNPSKIQIKNTKLPYPENYRPSDIIFIDGKVTEQLEVGCDNLHLYISQYGGFKKSMFDLIEAQTYYNFLCLYTDKRLNLNIWEESPKILVFNDLKRIAFKLFRKEDKLNASNKNYEKFESYNDNYKRYLLYLTPKSRALKKVKDPETGKEIYPLSLLDDILNVFKSKDLNNIAQQIKKLRREELMLLNKIHRTSIENLSNEEKIKELENEHKKLIDDLSIAKLSYTNTQFTLDNILSDKISVHFLIIGLNDDNRDFEDALVARALTRGILVTTESIDVNKLPITEIHSKYDIYIYTPTINDWDPTSRFIPECIYYSKKIYFTKQARKENSKNLALNIRITDIEKHMGSLSEDDIYDFPKMQMTRNLLGYWL